MSDASSPHPSLEEIRGSLGKARANARTVAALTDNPGCGRRRVIDAAGVHAHELAAKLGHAVTRGQSPFAITSGNRFEYRLKKGSDYKLLAEALQPFVTLPTDDLKVRDLQRVKGVPIGQQSLELRAQLTEEVLASVARGDSTAPHIVDHPVLVFDMGGTSVYLEPDALAFRIGNRLELVEIKSYAIIDDQADPGKLASTAGQSAVYLLALRATLERLGFDPNLLEWSVILVAPRNFGRQPTAHRIPLRKKAVALQRVLGAVPNIQALLQTLPAGLTLDVNPSDGLNTEDHRVLLDQALRALPMLFVPECLSSCDMARYCRHCAVVDDDPSRLGRAARDALAGVPKLTDALRLATSGPRKHEPHLADVAQGLSDAYQAINRARDMAPAECELGTSASEGGE